MNKVIGGTPKGNSSICGTCRNAVKLIGLNLQQEIYCNARAHTPRVPFPVAECSLYDDMRLPSIQQMHQIAWEIHSRNRGPVGFGDQSQRTDIVITPPRDTTDQPAMPQAPMAKENS